MKVSSLNPAIDRELPPPKKTSALAFSLEAPAASSAPAPALEDVAVPNEEERAPDPSDLLLLFLSQPLMPTSEAPAAGVSAGFGAPARPGAMTQPETGVAPALSPEQREGEPLLADEDKAPALPERGVRGARGEASIREAASRVSPAPLSVSEGPLLMEAPLTRAVTAPRSESPQRAPRVVEAAEPALSEAPRGEVRVTPVEGVGASRAVVSEGLELATREAVEAPAELSFGGASSGVSSFEEVVEGKTAERAAPMASVVSEEEVLAPTSRVQLVIGEGREQVTLLVSATEHQVRVVAQSASPQLLEQLKGSAQELQNSLQQHGLNLSHFGSGAQPEQRPPQEREEPLIAEGQRLEAVATHGKKARAIA